MVSEFSWKCGYDGGHLPASALGHPNPLQVNLLDAMSNPVVRFRGTFVSFLPLLCSSNAVDFRHPTFADCVGHSGCCYLRSAPVLLGHQSRLDPIPEAGEGAVKSLLKICREQVKREILSVTGLDCSTAPVLKLPKAARANSFSLL